MASSSICSWACVKCTFINEGGSGGRDECMICQEPRKGSSAVEDAISNTAGRGLCFESSIRFSDLSSAAWDGIDAEEPARDSISALHHMSFAAWESDRKPWTCEACTFLNGPRYLMCGACGMAEGTAAVEDELISSGLQRMSPHEAHEFLMKAVHKQLDSDREDELRHERALELLRDLKIDEGCAYDASKFEKDFAATECANVTDQKLSTGLDRAREHIETLERIQQAERQEHEEMSATLQLWRMELREDPNDEQEQEMERQEEMLESLLKEWGEREQKLRRLRMRLDGNLASI